MFFPPKNPLASLIKRSDNLWTILDEDLVYLILMTRIVMLKIFSQSPFLFSAVEKRERGHESSMTHFISNAQNQITSKSSFAQKT